MADPFLAEIVMFGGNFAPRGWAFNDGQLLPIASNSALFSLLGTIYGGDGRTTFALPEMRGRSPMHAGNGPGLSDRRLGQRGGSEVFTLTNAHMPAHTHSLYAENGPPTTNNPNNAMLANLKGAGAVNAAGQPVDPVGYKPHNASNGEKIMASAAIGNTGGGQAIFKQSPYIAVNFIIALQGIFPSRS